MPRIRLSLSSILLDESTQCRERTDPALVEEYAEAYRHEETLPPPDVFGPLDESGLPDGANVWIGDGHTRVRGALAADLAFLTCEVHLGGEEDAFAWALRANRHHGARVTAADKRHAVRKALERWPGLSDREIGRRADVGYTLVASVRAEQGTARGGQLEEKRTGADGKERRLPQRPAQEPEAPAAPLFPVGLGGAPPEPPARPFTPTLFGGAPDTGEAARTAAPGAVTIEQDGPAHSSSFVASNQVEKEEASASPATTGPTGTLIGVGPPPEAQEAQPARKAAAKPEDPYEPGERIALLRASRCLKDVPEAERPALAAALRELAAELAPALAEQPGVVEAERDTFRAERDAALARVRELEAEIALEAGASCGACELAQERVRELEQQVRLLEAKAERLTQATADLLAGEAPTPAPLRIALIGCGAKKLDRAARARDLYVGPLFRAALAYAEAEEFDGIFVLSAKHGFVRLGDKLEPYDVALEGLSADERGLLGALVVRDLVHEPAGEPAEITLLAGEGYAALLDGAPWKVHAPLAGLQVGERLAWFKQQREEEPAAPPAPCGAKHPTGPVVCGEPAGHKDLHRGAPPHSNLSWNTPKEPAAGLEELPPAKGEPAGALSVKCSQCNAKPGDRCKNYKGQGQAPHSGRVKAAKGTPAAQGPAPEQAALLPGEAPRPACNEEASSGGDRGPRRCTREPGHAGKHVYKEPGEINGRWTIPARRK